MSAIEIHTHLQELQAEPALTSIDGLAMDSVYMADLDGEIEATTRAYVGAAVTEIGTFRAQLSGRAGRLRGDGKAARGKT